jgi:hypothetical protein
VPFHSVDAAEHRVRVEVDRVAGARRVLVTADRAVADDVEDVPAVDDGRVARVLPELVDLPREHELRLRPRVEHAADHAVGPHPDPRALEVAPVLRHDRDVGRVEVVRRDAVLAGEPRVDAARREGGVLAALRRRERRRRLGRVLETLVADERLARRGREGVGVLDVDGGVVAVDRGRELGVRRRVGRDISIASACVESGTTASVQVPPPWNGSHGSNVCVVSI